MRGYDSHFIVKKAFDINSQIGNRRIDDIPNSNEQFMSFNIGDLKLIDSMQLMPSSLEKLVDNLVYKGKKEDKYHKFKHMRNQFKEDTEMLC